MSESGPRWDTTPQHTGRVARLVRRWRLGLALLLALGAVSVVVVPLFITGHRFEQKLSEKNPLQELAKEAQPATATVFDSGFRPGMGFAIGISRDAPAAVLAAVAPAPWEPVPTSADSRNVRRWRTDHLALIVRADPCLRLERCKPGDTLVYTEVRDVA